MAAYHWPGVAFITGAGSGIGEAVAKSLVEGNCKRLVLVDNVQAGLTSTAAQLSDKYPDLELELVLCDIREADQVDNAISRAVQRFGSIEYAANCAGLFPRGAGSDSINSSEEDFRAILKSNQRGVCSLSSMLIGSSALTWLCLRAELRQMLEQPDVSSGELGPGGSKQRGAIVNVASAHGLGAQPGFASLSAASYGIVGITRGVAMDYIASGVRINAVCVGATDTPGLKESGLEKALLSVMPMGRLIRPQEVAAAIIFLLSEQATAITGLAMPVDGGFSLCH